MICIWMCISCSDSIWRSILLLWSRVRIYSRLWKSMQMRLDILSWKMSLLTFWTRIGCPLNCTIKRVLLTMILRKLFMIFLEIGVGILRLNCTLVRMLGWRRLRYWRWIRILYYLLYFNFYFYKFIYIGVFLRISLMKMIRKLRIITAFTIVWTCL